MYFVLFYKHRFKGLNWPCELSTDAYNYPTVFEMTSDKAVSSSF